MPKRTAQTPNSRLEHFRVREGLSYPALAALINATTKAKRPVSFSSVHRFCTGKRRSLLPTSQYVIDAFLATLDDEPTKRQVGASR